MKFNTDKFISYLEKDGVTRYRIKQFSKYNPSVNTVIKFATQGNWSLKKLRGLFE